MTLTPGKGHEQEHVAAGRQEARIWNGVVHQPGKGS